MRLLFHGIATDAEVEDRFRRAIAVHLVEEQSLGRVVEMGAFESLGLESEGLATADE